MVRAQSSDAQATLDYVLDAIKGDRFKDAMGMTAEQYVEHALGQTALVYHRDGYAQMQAENDRLRGALKLAHACLSEVRRDFNAPISNVLATVREVLRDD